MARAGGAASLAPTVALPFTNQEAKFLIGLAFRRSLQAILWASQGREDLGVLRTERRRLQRLPAYREIGDYSFAMYLYAFVLPYYRDRLGKAATAEDLIGQNDLRAITGPLRGNPKLRVFANRNDFLTSNEDIAWLTARSSSAGCSRGGRRPWGRVAPCAEPSTGRSWSGSWPSSVAAREGRAACISRAGRPRSSTAGGSQRWTST